MLKLLSDSQGLPRSNVLYGYRMDGPRNWNEGHRFDGSTILIDPYAKLVEGRRVFGNAKEKMAKFFSTYDFDSSPFDWGDNYKLPNIPEVCELLVPACQAYINLLLYGSSESDRPKQ